MKSTFKFNPKYLALLLPFFVMVLGATVIKLDSSNLSNLPQITPALSNLVPVVTKANGGNAGLSSITDIQTLIGGGGGAQVWISDNNVIHPVHTFATTDTFAISSVSVPAGGSTYYEYYVIANFPDGTHTCGDCANDTSVNDGPATLNSSNYINISWDAVPLAVSYDVYNDSGNTSGHLANTQTNFLSDTGLAPDGPHAYPLNTSSNGAPVRLNGLYLSGVPSTFLLSEDIGSQFIGIEAGGQATNAHNSQFIGTSAGYQATNAHNSQFIGNGAGYQATNASNSQFIGLEAGYQAANASGSIFMGSFAGYQAANVSGSIFMGKNSGTNRSTTLWIDTQSQSPDGSYQPLIYGEFDNRLLKINGTLQVTNTASALAFIVSGTTNQVTFGATNTAPSSAVAPTKWISVQVSGESVVYRLPLYQ